MKNSECVEMEYTEKIGSLKEIIMNIILYHQYFLLSNKSRYSIMDNTSIQGYLLFGIPFDVK